MLAPGNDENQPPVGFGFVINNIGGRTREGVHNQMAAFGAANQPLLVFSVADENRVDPWSGCIDDDMGAQLVGCARQLVCVPYASYLGAVIQQAVDFGIRVDFGAVGMGRQSHFHAQALGPHHLAIHENN